MDRETTAGEYLYNFLYALFKRKYMTFAIFFVTFVGIVFGTYLTTTLWKATTKLRVQNNPKQQLALFEGITTPGIPVSGVNPANDIVQLLTSRELAEEVALKLGRDKLWDQRTNAPEKTKEIIRWHIYDFLIAKPIAFLQWLGILTDDPDNYLAMAVEELQEDLEEIELEEDTTIVNVTVWGESPEIATEISNLLANLAIEKNLQTSSKSVEKMLKSTKNQLDKAEQKLRNAQTKLRMFKQKSGLVLYDEEASIFLHRLDQYEAELKTMKSQLVALEIENMPDHPEVRGLKAKIDDYKKAVIPNLKRHLMELPVKEVEYEKLSWDLKVQEDTYTKLKQKILELEALKNSATADTDLTILDAGKVYSYVKPDWPHWVINIPLGFIGSFFVSIGFVLFAEYWNSSFKSVKELEEYTSLNALGAVPMLGYFERNKFFSSLRSGAESDARLPAKLGSKPRKPVTVQDSIADAVLLNSGKPQGNMFLMTSPGLHEGKSMVTAMLAQVLRSKGKKVLVIEADMRTPSLEKMFASRAEKGLADYYAGELNPEDVINAKNGVDLIFAGNPGAGVDPFEMLGSKKIEDLLKHAKSKYDFILIDSQCVKRYKEPLVLSSLTDGVILVVEANQTQKRAIRMASEKIKASGGQIKGVILNKQVNYVPDILQGFLS